MDAGRRSLFASDDFLSAMLSAVLKRHAARHLHSAAYMFYDTGLTRRETALKAVMTDGVLENAIECAQVRPSQSRPSHALASMKPSPPSDVALL